MGSKLSPPHIPEPAVVTEAAADTSENKTTTTDELSEGVNTLTIGGKCEPDVSITDMSIATRPDSLD